MKPTHPPSLSRPGRFSKPRRTTARWLFILMLGCVALPLSAAVSVPLKDALPRTHAVAYVHVTKLTETLQENTVQSIATFTLCGRAAGLGETKEFDVRFSPPPKPEKDKESPPAEPLFIVGRKCILLLARRDNAWEIVHCLKITDEGRLAETNAGEDIGLAPTMEADAVVQLIAAKLNPPGQKPRPKPLPSARNQPWNLMRSSPLRRVWPFFPH